MPTRTMSSKVPPAALTTARRLSNTRRVCVLMSPSTICPVAGSSGICPDRKRKPPRRTAWEYGPMAAGAWSVAIGIRVMRAILQPLHPVHHAEAAHFADHVGQVLAVADFDAEFHHRNLQV